MLKPVNEVYFFAIGALAIAAGTIAMKGRKPYSDPFQSSTGTSTPMGNRDDKLQKLANAIAKAEGFYAPNSLAKRANNPGNLKIASLARDWSAGKAVFGTLDDGWSALRRQLQRIFDNRSAYYQPTDTFSRFASVWTGGDNDSAWAQIVTNTIGTTSNDTLQGWINA